MMVECLKCGKKFEQDYQEKENYCPECEEEFQEVIENGGFIVRNRFQKRKSKKYPYIIEKTENLERGKQQTRNQYKTQVKALAAAKKLAEVNGVQAIFKYQKNGTKWILNNYLESHPDIMKKVKEENEGFPSRIF